MASPPESTPSHGRGESAHESVDETLASLGLGSREPLPLERGDVVGRYVVLEEIGRGAMGVVVAAYDPELDRKIALKLMPVGSRREGADVRLMREAQAMARLAHPNVITVHDVGTADGDVFIAMEFVEGGSLRSYLAGPTRPRWDEIVRRFIEAGEGLAAAHRQGIVHRDFKPDNVLVRADGRACVGDFGLARWDEAPAAASVSLSQLRSTSSGLASAAASVTLTGASMGTPAYMAPEQHLRMSVDARSDQFSFCVALWEALCGERPFAGTTLGSIALNVTSGKREAFARDSPVPTRIRTALERGLSTLPEQRFESMDALLVQLRAGLPDAREHRWRGAWLGLGLAGVGLLAAALSGVLAPDGAGEPPPAPCSRAAEQLDGIWDAGTRDAASQAFARSKRAHAMRSFERVSSSLDGLREDWIRSHTEACEATRVYGEQSEELLDRRMSCLADRRSELAAVAAALTTAGDETIDTVDELVSVIAPISSCDDLPQLERGLAAPPTQIREQVEKLRAELATLEVLRRSAADVDLHERAAKLVAQAEALAHEPVLVEALHLQAILLDGAGQFEPALAIARRAVALAARCQHRSELAEALTLVAWIEGNSHTNTKLGLWLLDVAAGESTALGDPVLLAVRIESDRGALLTVEGNYAGGLLHFERALALVERELGPDHMRAADLRFNIAATHHFMGSYEPAERGFRIALDVYTKLMGPEHPEVAQCHNNYAATLAELGRSDEAEQHARRAIEIWTNTGDRGNLAGAYANLGNAARAREDFEAALGFAQQAYEMRLEVFGPLHPSTNGSLTAIADNELALGRHEDAAAHYRAALAGLLESVGPEHPAVAGLRQSLAQLEDAHPE